MPKLINITDKFSQQKPQIQLGEKIYDVDNKMETVFKFQELAQQGTKESMEEAIEIAMGKQAVEDIAKDITVTNYRVLTIAIMAAMQELEYEEAEKRFRKVEERQGR